MAIVLLLMGVRTGYAQGLTSPFTPRHEPPELTLAPGATGELHVYIRVPAQHYLYQEKTTLEFQTLEGIRIKSLRYPRAVTKYDTFFQKELKIYSQDVNIVAVIEAPASLTTGRREIGAILAYQGCSEKLCYRLEEHPMHWVVHVGTTAVPPVVPQWLEPNPQPDRSPSSGGPSHWYDMLTLPDFRAILAHGVGLAFLITFIGGLLTAFTPCVLPLIPVILLIIGIHPGAHRRNFLLACCLTFGLALTYAVIGLIGALVGIPMSYLFQQRWFLGLIVIFYLTMALAMFGLFTLQLPSGLQQRLQRLGGAGPKGAFLAGISTGLLATPCAGPVIGALVAYVGAQRHIGFGFSLLLTYGLGFGAVFLLLGTFYGSLTQRIRRPAAARVVKFLLGLFLLIPALYYGWVLFGESRWQGNEDAAFVQAQSTQRPVMIEFTAKSCPPCLLFETTTLRDAGVEKALADEIVPLRIDTTFSTPEVKRLIDRYRVVGWPTILFASPNGEVYWDLSLVGDIPTPAQLLRAIAEARRRSQ